MPNNPDPVPTLVNLSLKKLIDVNIPPTINAAAFADSMGEFFRILELEFSIKNSEKKFTTCYLISAKG
jgi:hypothetical protein